MDSNSNAGRFTGCIPSYGDAGFCAAVMDTNRGSWQRPDIVSRLITKPNMVVVDLGAGTGYFADLFSKQLPEGKIIALDPETSLITWMEERKKRGSLDNVSVHQITENDPGLDQLSDNIDLLFVGYTYFHFDDPVTYFSEKVFPFIQDKTVVAIADMAPVQGQPRHTVSAQQVIKEMAEAGFELTEEPTTLYDQYLIIFKKNLNR
ncbi:MAG: methyltransferase domain-containing protein [Candidatus Scalindua sp.]|jgi:ubiquinone/menaquinone biosynthesis C-methylase UbiE|nr:methyltransferase domain-containing protein [Candidatus Scalindua sp.]MBT5305919.1 methyltransferase domain-containing protein [Candidatus Scalindua sp.]MBT6230164.1 methyltransferase domain-containing protein [Candidatus Scalindua sp.]MBT6562581.1 methyltransferase domain-containing protein [Candidatus Scalindua sp.]MBT7210485.1 methyltransferase domain-containing protein [Candidatus Scalindua sp.]